MNKANFYRQERLDGGIRVGISVNDSPLLGHFTPGKGEDNPALLWYVDIQVKGRSLPKEAEETRAWLREHGGFIQKALADAAADLEIGIDVDAWPFVKEIRETPTGVRGSLNVSAARRLAEGKLANKLRDTAGQWEAMLKNMQPLLRV